MKSIFIMTLIFILGKDVSFAQASEEKIKMFLDTLETGGIYFIGKAMPDFKMKSNTGKWYTNESLKNKISFLNFWFQYCQPCIAEMEALNNIYREFGKDKNFQFLSITYETRQTIDSISAKYKIAYPVLSTSADSVSLLNFGRGFPVTMVIDKEGKIAFLTFGGTTNPRAADLYFKNNVYPLLRCMLRCK